MVFHPLFERLRRATEGLVDLVSFLRSPSLFPEEIVRAQPLIATRTVNGSLFRLHSKDHIYREDFWRTFLDGEWKWKSQERFAGADLNCGHFFGLTESGAQAEAQFYGISDDRVILEVKASFDNILDLTDLGCMRYLMSLVSSGIRNPETVHVRFLLAFLLDQWAGGNALTDSIGAWACSNGYEGILFLSSRSIDPVLRYNIETGKEYDWELNEFCGFTAEKEALELQKDQSVQNLVVFSGANLTSSISEFRVENEPWLPNPYYGFETDELDVILHQYNVPFDSDYQFSRSEAIIHTLQAPGTPMRPWMKGLDGDQRRGPGSSRTP